VLVGDLGADTEWGPAVRGHDAVVHLAARVHVMNETADDPLHEFRQANVEGTRRLALDAAAAGVRRIVYMSSIKASGERSGDLPLSADQQDAPADPYGISKLEAETRLREVAADSQLSLVILRPALVYGPGVGGNVLRLMKLIASGLPIPLGSVRNQRSMIFAENLAALVVAALVADDVPDAPVLAADAETLSTPDVIRALASGMSRRARLVPMSPRLLRFAGALLRRGADIDRLIGDLRVASNVGIVPGYREVVPVRAGLAETGRSFAEERRDAG
jgi:nucleoside-diphosphate-sugar epimerase